jgi:hypothetical protein
MKILQNSIIFIVVLLMVAVGQAQNLGTALNFNAPEDVRAGFPVASITTEYTFYNPSGNIERKKEVSTLNSQQRLVSESRYDENGTLVERYTAVYDSTGIKNLGRKFERWHRYLGYTYEISKNEYDPNGYLLSTIDRNQKNQITMATYYTNDDHGNPTSTKVVDGNGNSYGEETAVYDYATNTVTSKVYDQNGLVKSETTSKIDYDANQDPSIIKNEQGDVIKSAEFEYTYRYDKKGNWTYRTNYKISNGTKVKQSECNRKITYRKD